MKLILVCMLLKIGGQTKGAAMVEFAIILPLFFILIAGMIDVGSFLYQLVLSSDAARYGARAAALRSGNPEQIVYSCQELKDASNAATTDYMVNTLKIPQNNWQLVGSGADICMLKSSDMVWSVPIVKQSIQITNTATDTCLFCYLSQFTSIRPLISATFMLPYPCDDAGEYPPLC